MVLGAFFKPSMSYGGAENNPGNRARGKKSKFSYCPGDIAVRGSVCFLACHRINTCVDDMGWMANGRDWQWHICPNPLPDSFPITVKSSLENSDRLSG